MTKSETKKEVFNHNKTVVDLYSNDKVMVTVLQGSQNYELETPKSDIDTKTILLPSFEDFVFNKKPISTTHILENNEHADVKDIRLMFDCFRKQNINFMEILFSPYYYCNSDYTSYWHELRSCRERIARYCPYDAVKCMNGTIKQKYHAMELKKEILAKYGYDGKQLHHMVRVAEFMERYIKGEERYEECLISKQPDFLIDIKNQKFPLEVARQMAIQTIQRSSEMEEEFCSRHERRTDAEIDDVLSQIMYYIIHKAVKKELSINA